MGGQLVKRAHTAFHLATQRGNPFSSNERHVLLYMCAVAMDTDEPPRFWGGREVLAEVALSRKLPPEDGLAERRSIFESVRKAVAGLVKRGALEMVGGAHPGRRQEYVLTVDNCLPAEWSLQPQVGSSATSDWANNNDRGA